MNPEKLKKMETQVRIGGKGTPRRKKKKVHATQANEEKTLRAALKKLSVDILDDVEEVNMIKDDGLVIHFDVPLVQTCLPTQTIAISGRPEERAIIDMLPEILSHLGPDAVNQLKSLAPKVVDKNAADVVVDFDNPPKKANGTKKSGKKP